MKEPLIDRIAFVSFAIAFWLWAIAFCVGTVFAILWLPVAMFSEKTARDWLGCGVIPLKVFLLLEAGCLIVGIVCTAAIIAATAMRPWLRRSNVSKTNRLVGAWFGEEE